MPEETGTLFASGFEDETSSFTTDFTGKTEGGTTTAEVQSTIKRTTGNIAAKLSFDGSDGNTFFYKTGLSTSGDDFYCRGYLYLGAAFDTTADNQQEIILTVADGATDVCQALIEHDAADDWRIGLRAKAPTDEWNGFSNYGDVVKETWHRLEVHWFKSATVGGFEAWLDGVSFSSDFSYNTSSYQPDEAYFGPRSTSAIDAGAMYWDDVRIEETGPIGGYDPVELGIADVTLTLTTNTPAPNLLIVRSASVNLVLTDTAAAGLDIERTAAVDLTATVPASPAQPVTFFYPISDITVTNFENELGQITGLYASLDEGEPGSASDYAVTSGGGNATYEALLTSRGDPAASDYHYVLWAFEAASGIPTYSIRATLLEGAVQRAQWIYNDITTGSEIQVQEVLSGAEADSLTDYTNLRMRWETKAGTF